MYYHFAAPDKSSCGSVLWMMKIEIDKLSTVTLQASRSNYKEGLTVFIVQLLNKMLFKK